jgi:hypothetical protein
MQQKNRCHGLGQTAVFRLRVIFKNQTQRQILSLAPQATQQKVRSGKPQVRRGSCRPEILKKYCEKSATAQFSNACAPIWNHRFTELNNIVAILSDAASGVL